MQILILKNDNKICILNNHTKTDKLGLSNYSSQFQWESPNSTTLNSNRGRDLTDNVSRSKKIHLFVRKYKTVNNVTQRYTYIGTADAMSQQNEKPIEIQYALHNKVPVNIYEEFEPEKITF